MSDQTSPGDSSARDRVTVRRAPRFGAFLVVGGFLGFVVTLVLTSLFEPDPMVGFTTLVAYFSLYGISGGVLLGAIAAVIVDRRSRRRARTVDVEREIVEARAAEAEHPESEPTEPGDSVPGDAEARDS